MLHSYMLMI